ncbi:putative disease resistance protein RGA3 [Argentina anserina]|uniref:putative disease resistance protein RGA3 n=1 Tax=Argentina anserina TaxID=57926 RepID=UPI0021767A04|nr:putative disease resistance protein RGA3 [Potentilla anserina]XP_050368206.1 putative disease resistance protein RGA3 [Potentilla anserina]XP_050368207.1 putative disease resistance protein RGA3 [Potentilla anserina]XP_050368208.1 putative disease resistance protein RGA3 [Potentilla anserina]XP_050368209.1 putative disease resistance protein RGA3 [Potentilla anserina]
MAEALVNVLLERLATITFDKVGEEFRLVTGVEKEVMCLTRNLEAIRAVLEDAEQRQVTQATVRRWLSELTEVSLEMDDVLDEWITEVLKRQMERQEQEDGRALNDVATKKKVCFPCLSSCFCFGQANQLLLRRDISVRIKELNERIDLIGKEKESFTFQSTTRVAELPRRPKSTSLPNVKTFGRDNEKNLIVSKLLSEGSQEKEVPLIIPIVGMGGMGKTTLAQLVYNDENVKSHYDKRIWVCVSDPFEESKVARAIIEELDRNNSSKNSDELQTLMQCIYELLEGKRFLLVLDDVWSPTLTQWEELIKPLRNGAIGSRVLVTTRKEEIVVLMKATTQMISLKKLGEAFCLSLFYYSADVDESRVSKEFLDVGLEIVKRCKGLPLVAKTLGSLMRNKNKIQEWRAILNSKIWELKVIEHEVFQPLLLSYYDLDPPLRLCLLYCIIYPKDCVYYKSNLVELWMSQDYLNAKGCENKEIIGQAYFDDLLMRSFFQDIEVDDENGDIRCKIHDTVHDFLQYLTKNECLILDLELDASDKSEVANDKIRHLSVLHYTTSDSFISVESILRKYKKLRTLTVADVTITSSMFELIVQLKCLRTLVLRVEWDFDPECIGGLIHLRYFALCGSTRLKELPSAMSSLYNLQTLRLVNCFRLTKVDVRRLINLRHLYVERCEARGSIIGIEKLTHLQTLDVFRVGGCEDVNKLEDLKGLNQLQLHLIIQIEGAVNMVEENAAIMVNKAHLANLRLEFRNRLEQRKIMDGLEPHAALEYLTICGYKGSVFSDWLSSLHRVKVLSLEDCPNCEILPPLGKLASLESLVIRGFHGVKKVGVGFLGVEQGQTSSSSVFISFPNLKQLTFHDMGSWKEWEGVEEETSDDVTIMPCLPHLTISSCYDLETLPDFLRNKPLQKMTIRSSPIFRRLWEGEDEERAEIPHFTPLLSDDASSCEAEADYESDYVYSLEGEADFESDEASPSLES